MSDRGEITRVRSGVDPSGRWTSETVGSDQRIALELIQNPDGSIALETLISGERVVRFDPPLLMQPAAMQTPLSDETGCTLSGRSGIARSSMVVDRATGEVVLELVFEVTPTVVTRRFRWKTEPDRGVVEESASLRVTVLGLPVRDQKQTMRLMTD